MSFFEQFKTAVYKFQSYPKLIMQSFGRVICYLMIFTVVISVIEAIPYAVAYRRLGGISGMIQKYVPEFSIENGKFKCESIDYSDELSGIKIFIDDNEDAENVDVRNSGFYLVADSDKMIVGNGIQESIIEFSQFEDEYIDKSMLVSFFSSTRVRLAIFAILGVTTLFSLSFGTVMWLFMLSFAASLINLLFVHARISYGDIFKLTVYARTFPSIFIMVIGLAGFMYAEIVFLGLFITYVYLGLKNIKKQEAVILAEF